MGKRNQDFFHFKQFAIYQKESAMKLGTDSVLIGSWAPVDNAKTALDIGTGTGVVALMLAQRNKDIQIQGIEIDLPSVKEAIYNVSQSPWSNRIKIIHGDFRKISQTKSYDLIVSNPPYFESNLGLSSPDPRRAKGRQNFLLSQEELVIQSSALLAQDGCLSLILPAEESMVMIKAAKAAGLYCRRLTWVSPLVEKPPHRCLLAFYREPGFCKEEQLVIEDSHHHYSKAMRNLTSEFYLKL